MDEIEYYKTKPRIFERLIENILIEFKNKQNSTSIILTDAEPWMIKDIAYSLMERTDSESNPEYPYEFMIIEATKRDSYDSVRRMVDKVRKLNPKYLGITIGFDFPMNKTNIPQDFLFSVLDTILRFIEARKVDSIDYLS